MAARRTRLTSKINWFSQTSPVPLHVSTAKRFFLICRAGQNWGGGEFRNYPVPKWLLFLD